MRVSVNSVPYAVICDSTINPLYSDGLFHPDILEESICYLRGIRCNFSGLFGSREKLLLANSVDPDQMPHYVASALFAYVPLLGFPDNKVWIRVLYVGCVTWKKKKKTCLDKINSGTIWIKISLLTLYPLKQQNNCVLTANNLLWPRNSHSFMKGIYRSKYGTVRIFQ